MLRSNTLFRRMSIFITVLLTFGLLLAVLINPTLAQQNTGLQVSTIPDFSKIQAQETVTPSVETTATVAVSDTAETPATSPSITPSLTLTPSSSPSLTVTTPASTEMPAAVPPAPTIEPTPTPTTPPPPPSKLEISGFTPIEIKSGEQKIINFTLTNTGEGEATGVQVDVTLPAGLEPLWGQIQPQPKNEDGLLKWAFPDPLPPQQPTVFTLPVQPRPDAAAGQVEVQIVYRSSTQPEVRQPIPVTIIASEPPPPSLQITQSRLEPATIKAGVETSLRFTVKNSGGLASDVKVTVKLRPEIKPALDRAEPKDKQPQLVAQDAVQWILASLDKDPQDFVLPLQTQPDVPANSYPITISAGSAEQPEQSATIKLKVEAVGAPDLQLTAQKITPETVKPGEMAVLSFNLDNTGTAPAMGVEVSVTLPQDLASVDIITPSQGFRQPVTPGSPVMWVLDELSPHQSMNFQLSLQTQTSAFPGPLPVGIAYKSKEDGQGKAINIPLTVQHLSLWESIPLWQRITAGTIVIVAIILLGAAVVGLWSRRRKTRKKQPMRPGPIPPGPASEPAAPQSTQFSHQPQVLAPPGIVSFLECPTRTQAPNQFRLTQLEQGREEIIGRAMPAEGVTVRIDESYPRWDTVSRLHARIYRDAGGRIIIEDMKSQNGVQVEGRRSVRNLLKNNWRVTIGGVEFVYREGIPVSNQLGVNQ